MKNTGWVILPLGWLLIVAILAMLSYIVIKKLRWLPPPPEPEA
jgi:hypothetical protein